MFRVADVTVQMLLLANCEPVEACVGDVPLVVVGCSSEACCCDSLCQLGGSSL